jgi:signal peptidase II
LSARTTPIVAAACLSLDAATKFWALHHLQQGTVHQFIPGVLTLILTTNTGGAFGLGHQHKELKTVLAVALTLALVSYAISRERSPHKLAELERLGLGMMIGGSLGNILDRMMLGHVTDFLNFAFMEFPVFNVGDALIDVGVAAMLLAACPPLNRSISSMLSKSWCRCYPGKHVDKS